MEVIRGYKVELKLNNKQITLAKKHAGTSRWAYNWGLTQKKEAYAAKQLDPTQKIPTAIDLHKELNKLKKTDYSWMYDVSKCAPQEALRDLDVAFANFYRGLAGGPGPKVGFPQYKSKNQGIGSFTLTGSIAVEAKQIRLPRMGRLRLKEAGYIPTSGVRVLSATVSEKAGHWFVSVQVQENVLAPQAATGATIGVDLGIKLMAVTSDGRRFANPKALRQAENALKRAQRKVSRRQKGSKNRTKAKKGLAIAHYRVANIRRDALHKATSAIVARTKPDGERPSKVVLEDLNVRGMLKNHKLAKAIADVGFGEFRRQMTYKTGWAGEELVIADRFFASTKMCSGCGYVKKAMPLSERTFVCENCGLNIDRDLNAALNLAAVLT